MKTLDNVTFRWLDGDDLDQLEPILAEKGWASLNKNTSRARAAYDEDGNLIGWTVFQLFPCAGPGFVVPEWRGTGLFEVLSDDMHEFLSAVNCRGCILVADNPITAKLAEKHGMKKIESPVYIKVDTGEGI